MNGDLPYFGTMPPDPEIGFPPGTPNERELLLRWLGFLRGAVLRKIVGLNDEQARWRPNDALISLLGIVNHLTHVERRWIDGGMGGQEVSRAEEEFSPGPELTVATPPSGRYPHSPSHAPGKRARTFGGSCSIFSTRQRAMPDTPTPPESFLTAPLASDFSSAATCSGTYAHTLRQGGPFRSRVVRCGERRRPPRAQDPCAGPPTAKPGGALGRPPLRDRADR